MAALSIVEFKLVEVGPTGPLPIPLGPPLAGQTLTISGTSGQSTAVQAATRFVRLCSDTACYYTIGTNPTAATTDIYLPAGVIDWIAVPVNSAYKVAART